VRVTSHDFVVSSSDSVIQQDAENEGSYFSLTVLVCTLFYVEDGGSRIVFAQTWATSQSNIAFTALTCITGVNKNMALTIITLLTLCSPCVLTYDLNRSSLI
jgi:hypothetical protein